MTSIVTDRLCGSIPTTTRLTSSMLRALPRLDRYGPVESGGHRYYQQGIPFLSLSRPDRRPGQRTPNVSHTPHVDSRNPSDHPEHLNRTLAKARSAVNGTSSRDPRY